MASTHSESLPTVATWFRFTYRARFHDRPGFPTLKRYYPVDLRIMAKVRNAAGTSAAIVTFYSLPALPDPFDSSQRDAIPPPMLCVEIRRRDTVARFIPSWFGHRVEDRAQRLERASIVHIEGLQ